MSIEKKDRLATIVVGILSLMGGIYFLRQSVGIGICTLVVNIVITICHIFANFKYDPNSAMLLRNRYVKFIIFILSACAGGIIYDILIKTHESGFNVLASVIAFLPVFWLFYNVFLDTDKDYETTGNDAGGQ